MKTQEQIIARIAEIKGADFFGTHTGELVNALNFENAKEYLRENVTAEQWKPPYLSDADVRAAVTDYLPFAWDKANNCRGLSAGRSIDHMRGMFWLLGEDALVSKLDEVYEFYGKPCLVLCSERVGFDWRKADDGDWVNNEGDAGTTAELGLAKHGIELQAA